MQGLPCVFLALSHTVFALHNYLLYGLCRVCFWPSPIRFLCYTTIYSMVFAVCVFGLLPYSPCTSQLSALRSLPCVFLALSHTVLVLRKYLPHGLCLVYFWTSPIRFLCSITICSMVFALSHTVFMLRKYLPYDFVLL